MPKVSPHQTHATSRIGIGTAVFTAGQLARLLGCSGGAVAHAIDTGVIKGYRIPHATGHRRVKRADLIHYCRSNGREDVLKQIGAIPYGKNEPRPEDYHSPIPLADWHDDDGFVLWWQFPVHEPPYCGSPQCDDWPGYHTHWTPIPMPHEPEAVPSPSC